MEEKKTKSKVIDMPVAKVAKEKESPKMISVDQANAQMQQMMTKANTKISQIAAQLQQLENVLRDRTVEQLFKVIEFAHHFEPEFVERCTKALTEYLTQMALTENKEESKPEEKTE